MPVSPKRDVYIGINLYLFFINNNTKLLAYQTTLTGSEIKILI